MTPIRLYRTEAELKAHYATVRRNLGMAPSLNLTPRSMVPRLSEPEIAPPRVRKKRQHKPPRLPASIEEIRRSIRTLERVSKKAARHIIRDVAEREGIIIDDILSDRRFPHLFSARAEIAVRLRELNFSYIQIGVIMNRDHSSVMHMVRRFKTPAWRKQPQKTRMPECDVRVTG